MKKRDGLSSIGTICFYLGIVNARKEKLIIWNPLSWVFLLIQIIAIGVHEVIEEKPFTFKIK